MNDDAFFEQASRLFQILLCAQREGDAAIAANDAPPGQGIHVAKDSAYKACKPWELSKSCDLAIAADTTTWNGQYYGIDGLAAFRHVGRRLPR